MGRKSIVGKKCIFVGKRINSSVLEAWLYWLAHSSDSCRISGERSFDPRRQLAPAWRSTGVAILLANLRASGGGRRRSTGGRAAAGSPALLSSVSYPAATVARTAVAAVITVTVATVEGLAVTAATAATTRPI